MATAPFSAPGSGDGLGGDPPDASEAGRWGARGVLWGLIVAVLAVILGVGIVTAAIGDSDLETTAGKIAGQSVVELALIAVAIFFARGPAIADALPRLGLVRFPLAALKTAGLVYLAYFGFAIAWGLLVSPEQDEVARDLGGGESVAATALAGVMIVVLAPLGEEIFVRGFMFGGLRASWGLWPAAIASGAFFGLLHYTDADSWGVVVQLAFFGAGLAWLYDRTGSLWPPIIVHAVNNSLAFAIQLSS